MVGNCLWLAEASDPDESPALRGALDADVCVVGGGYSGLWTALRVLSLEPAARVVLIEAARCGEAASGRNGGFALSLWPKLTSLVKLAGREEALRLAQASSDVIGEIESSGVEARFRWGGWLWTATSRAQLGAWEHAAAAGAPLEPLSASELAARTGSDVHLGGVFEREAATVQPALLARGLRRLALGRGVAVYERTPMVSLDRASGVVRTPGGSVRADAIVLATNAWLARLPELGRSLAVVSSDVVATAPLPDALRASGWTGGESISDSRMMVRYWRTTSDGRVVLGRGGSALAYGARFDFHEPPATQTDLVAAELPRLVPATRGVPIEYRWGGAVDRSADGLPFFGVLADGRARVVYGAGFSGNGVAPTVLGAKVMAALALRRSDEWSGSALVRSVPPGGFPPEPLRFVGGAVVRRAVGRKERLEDAGRTASAATRLLAGLAPRGR